MSIRVKAEAVFRGRKIKKLSELSRKELQQSLEKSALVIQGNARRSISRGQRRGEPYTRYGPTRSGRASAPGEFPKSDLGGLVESINFSTDKKKMRVRVGTNLDYGEHLEFGTTKMDARPWLGPTVRDARKRIDKMQLAANKRAVRQIKRDKKASRSKKLK